MIPHCERCAMMLKQCEVIAESLQRRSEEVDRQEQNVRSMRADLERQRAEIKRIQAELDRREHGEESEGSVDEEVSDDEPMACETPRSKKRRGKHDWVALPGGIGSSISVGDVNTTRVTRDEFDRWLIEAFPGVALGDARAPFRMKVIATGSRRTAHQFFLGNITPRGISDLRDDLSMSKKAVSVWWPLYKTAPPEDMSPIQRQVDFIIILNDKWQVSMHTIGGKPILGISK